MGVHLCLLHVPCLVQAHLGMTLSLAMCLVVWGAVLLTLRLCPASYTSWLALWKSCLSDHASHAITVPLCCICSCHRVNLRVNR
jgi:hypothetical protein